VIPLRDLDFGALRYFDAREAPPAGVAGVLGGALPGALRAVERRGSAGEIVLAWRTPTETWVLAPAGGALAALEAAMADAVGWGCLVNQGGGLRGWRVSGARARDVIERVGSTASWPVVGEARTSRMGELPVLSLSLREGEVILVAERVYTEHLLGWLSETAADF
jgi:sarcosine oxidase gamma subunit